MKVIMAKIMDPTNLELSQPIQVPQGKLIQISVPDISEDDRLCREAANKHFLEACDAEDAIYDRLYF